MLSKIGCQADFLYKHSIILKGQLEKFSLLNVIIYFSISGDSKQKKYSLTKIGSLATTAWGLGGSRLILLIHKYQ